jgi:hypothetical protein
MDNVRKHNNFINIPSSRTFRFSVRFVIGVTQFQASMVANCRALICCMKVRYVADHEEASSLLFQFITCILRILTIFSTWVCEAYCTMRRIRLRLTVCVCAKWRKTSASTHRPITCVTGKEYREAGTVNSVKVLHIIMREPAEFSMSITLIYKSTSVKAMV